MTNPVERLVNLAKLNSQPPKELIPEMREEIMKNEIGAFAQFVDGLVPVSVQRVIARMLPGNVMMQRLIALNDFRIEHQILVSRSPLS